MSFLTWLKRYLAYNLLVLPFIYGVYSVYMLLIVQLSWGQFVLWLTGGALLGLVLNAVIQPYVRWVTLMIERRVR